MYVFLHIEKKYNCNLMMWVLFLCSVTQTGYLLLWIFSLNICYTLFYSRFYILLYTILLSKTEKVSLHTLNCTEQAQVLPRIQNGYIIYSWSIYWESLFFHTMWIKGESMSTILMELFCRLYRYEVVLVVVELT